MNISIKLLSENARIPTQEPGSAGYDLYSVEDCVVFPQTRLLAGCGISLEIPKGYYGHISDRSGMAWKKGIHCMGKIIDPSYRGEIRVILYNTDLKCSVAIKQGDRIAQIIFKQYFEVNFEKVNELSESKRQDKGFGSSGN